jgi:hypothetical protein
MISDRDSLAKLQPEQVFAAGRLAGRTDRLAADAMSTFPR